MYTQYSGGKSKVYVKVQRQREDVAAPPQYTGQECKVCGPVVKKSLSVLTHGCHGCGVVLARDRSGRGEGRISPTRFCRGVSVPEEAQ
jgi:Putative transposase DNA-binding domain